MASWSPIAALPAEPVDEEGLAASYAPPYLGPPEAYPYSFPEEDDPLISDIPLSIPHKAGGLGENRPHVEFRRSGTIAERVDRICRKWRIRGIHAIHSCDSHQAFSWR